jgi:hypothetical protein
MQQLITIKFKPVLKSENSKISSNKFVKNHIKEISEWYLKNLTLEELEQILNYKIITVEFFEDYINVKFQVLKDDINVLFFYNYITDPDDDGNYLLKIGKKEYLVYSNNYQIVSIEDI